MSQDSIITPNSSANGSGNGNKDGENHIDEILKHTRHLSDIQKGHLWSKEAIDQMVNSSYEPVTPCISYNTSQCVIPAQSGNILVAIPEEIKISLNKEMFLDRDSLLLSGSFIEHIREKFLILYNKSNHLYQTMTYTLTSEILCLSDDISVRTCVLQKELKILSQSFVKHEKRLEKLTNIARNSIYGVEALRSLMSRPFEEVVPRLILTIHRQRCKFQVSPVYSPDGSESSTDLQERAADRMFDIVTSLKKILHKLDLISNYLEDADLDRVNLFEKKMP